MRFVVRTLLVRALGFGALVVAALGCGDGADVSAETRDFLVRDSAGVEIVENSAEAIEAAPALELIEELRLGVREGREEEQFSFIADLDLGPDGEMYLLDRTKRVIRVFDAGGDYLRTIGRRGEGPGEFSWPTSVAIGSDTILVVDRGGIQLFDLEGRLLAAHPPTPPPDPDPRLTAHVPAGWYIAELRRDPYNPEFDGPYANWNDLFTLDPDSGALVDAAFRIDRQPNYALGRLGFGRTPLLAPQPEATIANDGRIYVTAGAAYQIDVHAPDRSLARRIRADIPLIPVTDADLDRSLALELARYDGRELVGEAAMVVEMLREDAPSLGHADHRPVVGRMWASPDGSLLLERLDLDPDPLVGGDPVTWDLLDPNGRIAGRFITPPDLLPLLFTGSELYARVLDEFDVQYVVRYRIGSAAP